MHTTLEGNMVRVLLGLSSSIVVLACVSGCNWDFDLLGPSIDSLRERYARGTTQETHVDGFKGTTSITSSNPNVVRVEKLGENRFKLHFVGSGKARLVASDSEGGRGATVRVAPHEGYRVTLVETAGTAVIPVDRLSGKTILSGEQDVAVLYYDSAGILFGRGLAEASLPETLVPCEQRINAPVDLFCLNFQTENAESFIVRVGDEDRRISVNVVHPASVTDLRLLVDHHEAYQDDDLVRIDAVGVDDSGELVYGIHARFTSPGPTTDVGYFTYQAEPKHPASTLVVSALNCQRELVYQGEDVRPMDLNACSAAPLRAADVPGGIGPMVLALAMLTRRRRLSLLRTLSVPRCEAR
jgi:hypothetical protein